MEALLLYVSKMILCSAILYAYYHFFLKNKSFHHYNRFYLLAAVLVSAVVPVLRIPFLFPQEEDTPAFVYRTLEVIVVTGGEMETDLWSELVSHPLFSIAGIALLLYGSIVMWKMFRFSTSLHSIFNIKRKYPQEVVSDIHLYQTNEPGTPFSFFSNIFWNRKFPLDSDKGQQLFRHELFHVKQRHSIDNVFMELATAICWINPVFHLIKRELHTIHEFLADEYASSGSDRYAYAEILLVHAIHEKKQSPLVHYFFRSPIKRRIAMILQTTSNTSFSYLRRLMILPIATLLFSALVLRAQKSIHSIMPESSANTSVSSHPEKKLAPLTVVIDAGHGGQDGGAQGHDRLEKEFTLAIAQKVRALSANYGVNVLLTRNDDSYPDLKQRTEFTKKSKADLFISLHIGSEQTVKGGVKVPEDQLQSGIDAFISWKNRAFEEQNVFLGSALLLKLNEVYNTKKVLQTRQTGIWVLDAAPCPAILLECGYLSNKKDVAFLSSGNNQEKIAAKILEGIVAFQKLDIEEIAPVKHFNASTTSQKDTVPTKNIQDGFFQSFGRHMNRTLRYPLSALEHNKGGTVYFRLAKDFDGNTTNVEILKNPPTNLPANVLNEIVVVAYAKQGVSNSTPSSGIQEAFAGEVERAALKHSKYSASLNTKTNNVYYKVTFKLEAANAGQEVDKIFHKAEVEATFEGGLREWARFLNENLRYPDSAINKNVQGMAIIQFIVTTDGVIKDASIVQDPGAGLGEEALRIINKSNGKWVPAVQNGKKVNSYKKQPITFRLGEG
ncbi:MAG: TonB family protein [Chitinophagaceae bacterium]